MITYYRSYRYIDVKSKWVIVDENGMIVNKNPTKEELKGLDKFPEKDGRSKSRCGYVVGTICYRCIEEKNVTNNSVLCPGIAYVEKDKEGNETGRHICASHYNKDKRKNNSNCLDNVKKSLANCRTENQDPNSSNAKGDNILELACILYELENLNKKYNNYTTSIDCYDSKTGLYHQIQGRNYNSRNGLWLFSNFEDEWGKIFENMICFCKSKDGKIVERIYKFPWKEIMRVKGIAIYKNPSKGGQQNEQYRIVDKDELKKANDIWKEILNKSQK